MRAFAVRMPKDKIYKSCCALALTLSESVSCGWMDADEIEKLIIIEIGRRRRRKNNEAEKLDH